MERETKLGNQNALRAEVEKTGDADLKLALSNGLSAVNDTVADMVHGVPPFPYVRRQSEKLTARIAGRHDRLLGHA